MDRRRGCGGQHDGARGARGRGAHVCGGLLPAQESLLCAGCRTGQPAKFQTGFIIATALCEAAGLLGFVGIFVTHNREAYLLFAIGALGLLLHFPRRDQLAAAYRKGF